MLPLDDYYQMPTKWGFFGVDSIANLLIQRGVVQPKPDGYFGDVPGYKADIQATQTALLSGDLAAVPRLLDASGIDKIIVRHDLIRDMPGRNIADDEVLAKALKRTPGMTRTSNGELELWQTKPASGDPVRAYNNIVSAGARPDAAAGVIGSVGTGNAVMALKASTKPSLLATVDDSPQVTKDSVQWPVPAVDAGVPRTTVDLKAGTYVVAQRARASAVLRPRWTPPRKKLVFSDPTKVRVDGQVVSSVTPWVHPPHRHRRHPGRTAAVSLDAWGREALPRPPGSPVQRHPFRLGRPPPWSRTRRPPSLPIRPRRPTFTTATTTNRARPRN
ncbi:MAG: hypothetical protein IPN52_01830 [Micrococcales bacterium]|nr:hypothetical protein [Micrococcales bacterium]